MTAQNKSRHSLNIALCAATALLIVAVLVLYFANHGFTVASIVLGTLLCVCSPAYIALRARNIPDMRKRRLSVTLGIVCVLGLALSLILRNTLSWPANVIGDVFLLAAAVCGTICEGAYVINKESTYF